MSTPPPIPGDQNKIPQENKGKEVPALYQRGWIYFMLFLVLGPLGLPLLYKSPNFSDREKYWITIIVFIYLAVIVILFGIIITFYVLYILKQLEQL